MQRSRRGLLALDGLLIFLYAATLIWPVSQTKYLDAWGSIESTFIADGRFLAENWPRPLWQPNWYCGTRFNFVYPPALRYGTAVLTRFYPMPPSRAYHIYVSILYATGILGVFLLARVAGGSRAAGWMAALGTAWLSPVHLLVSELRNDTADYVTQRLKALVLYGEGPHISSLAILPFALAAAFLALRNRSLAAMGWAAFASALVVSHNFYGGLALAMSFPFVVWSVWVTERKGGVWLWAAAMGLLAYGLTAWWLGPSYLRITVDNLRLVAQPGNLWSPAVAAAYVILYGAATWRWASGRPERAYVVFLAGVLGYFSLDTFGNYLFQYRIAGEPARLFPEWDMYLCLAGAEAIRRVAAGGGWKRTTAAALLFVAAILPVRKYIFHPWRLMTRYDPYQERVEYRMQDWVHRNLPGSRALAAGSVRFWYNAWHDLPQLGGGSEQGVSNQLVVTAQFRILQEPEPEQPILWAQAFGLDAFIVNEAASGEVYHDWVKPRQFDGRLPVLWDDGKGSVVYDIPRRYRSLARVVDRKRMDALKPMTLEGDIDTVRAYVDLMERGPEARTATRWQGNGRLLIDAPVGEGQSLVAQVSYDPQWRAWVDGKAVPIRKNVVGHVVVDVPPGAGQVLLVFETPLEDRIGLGVSLLSLLVVVWLTTRRQPAAESPA